MRVLIAHNRYRSGSPSGENSVVETEVEALRSAGVHVARFTTSVDELPASGFRAKVSISRRLLTGAPSIAELERLLDEEQPDVVHLHNVYPLITPLVIDACRRAAVPVVATVHNFRLRCMKGTMFRAGSVCEACAPLHIPWPGVLHGCYQESVTASAPMAVAMSIHRGSWDSVDRFIAVSPFVADCLRSWGVEPDRITVKPNSVPDPGECDERGSGYLFVGRLSEEKGADILLDAWAESGLDGRERLVVVGTGPLHERLARSAARLKSVTLAGSLSADEVSQWRNRTSVAVVPSRWNETFGLVAVESLAHGRPVIATRLGALTDAIDDSVGWPIEATREALVAALRDSESSEVRATRGASARARFLSHWITNDAAQLAAIYSSVMK